MSDNHNSISGESPARHDQADDGQTRGDALWDSVRTVYARRRLVLGVTLGVAVASIIISLLLPNWYLASSRVLTPESSGGGFAGLSMTLNQLSPLASSLLDGPQGDFNRYLAILDSRTLKTRVVEEFNLIEVYETRDADDPLGKAIENLDGNVDIVQDRRVNYLTVQVLDKDPQRAADMANFMVNELNRRHTQLATESAANYRKFVELRHNAIMANLDSVLTLQQQFQEQHGLIELPAQAEAFMGQMAGISAAAVEARIEATALAQAYGENNPRALAARSIVESADAEVARLYGGSDRLMPVEFAALPSLGRQYAEIAMEILVLEEILKFVRPMYEQALFNEQRETIAVQVLDPAVPPVLKDRPRRMFIVIGATFSSFFLTLIFVLLREWFRRNSAYISSRLNGTKPEVAHAPVAHSPVVQDPQP